MNSTIALPFDFVEWPRARMARAPGVCDRVGITARLAPMMLRTRPHPLFATLLCLALLMMRVGGAHLHLCFDGTEPPASFHVFDATPHHESPAASATHQDADVAVTADVYSKPGKVGDQLPLALLAAIIAWALIRRPREFVPPYPAPAMRTKRELLRPPLRGPPLLTSL